MGVYLLKRILMTILVMLLAMVFLSAMPYLVPGDPVKTILGPRASQELVERVRHDMGLDLPVPVQIASFVRRALKGDLGSDFVSGLPVLTLIREVLPHTIILAISSLALAALLGIPLGIFSATHPDSLLDRLTKVSCSRRILKTFSLPPMFLMVEQLLFRPYERTLSPHASDMKNFALLYRITNF